MDKIKRYDLHKDDYSKLHFEVNDMAKYYQKWKEPASVPHRHSFYQVIWFTSAGQHFVDYEVIEHPANTILFIADNQVHHFCNESPNKGFLFHFNDYFIQKSSPVLMDRYAISIFGELGISSIHLEKSQTEKFQAVTDLIIDEVEHKSYNHSDQVFHLFQVFLMEIERILNAKQNKEERQDDYNIVVAFKKLIHQNLDQHLNIETYAAELNTNVKKLTAICKTYLALTPANFVKQRKVLEAKRMLSNQNIAIQNVAFSLGFDQPTYFTKYFKKEVGLTPKEFQNNFR